MLKLLQVVRLRRGSPDDGLAVGTIRVIVDLLAEDGLVYEVEVVDGSGRTVPLSPLPGEFLEPVADEGQGRIA